MLPIIAVSLSGIFIKVTPWKKAHELWFEGAAAELQDETVLRWSKRIDYFDGVDEVMGRLYPDLTLQDRTIEARKRFFESVCKYIELHPETINQDIVAFFTSIKQKFRLALITTHTEYALEKVWNFIPKNLFDYIACSFEDEKDEKENIFSRFIKQHGKPLLYLGHSRQDSYVFCQQQHINCYFANFDRLQEIEGVKSVHSLEELEKVITNI